MPEECPQCGSKENISDYREGEVYCKNCGFVIDNTLFDFGPEWRAFDQEQLEKRDRTGGLLRFAKLDRGLTTEIDRYDRDIKGRAIPPERKAKFYRLRKLHRRTRTSTSLDKNLSIALPELNKIGNKLNLPQDITEEAARLYRKVAKEGLVRGRSIEGMVAAVLYYVTRKNRLPKTLRELEKYSGVDKKDIGKCYRKIIHNLDLEKPRVKPEDYVHKFASRLGASGKTAAQAVEIVKKATQMGVIAGKTPRSVALGALRLAAEQTGGELREVEFEGISPHTIKSRYEELKKMVKGVREKKENRKMPVPQAA